MLERCNIYIYYIYTHSIIVLLDLDPLLCQLWWICWCTLLMMTLSVTIPGSLAKEMKGNIRPFGSCKHRVYADTRWYLGDPNIVKFFMLQYEFTCSIWVAIQDRCMCMCVAMSHACSCSKCSSSCCSVSSNVFFHPYESSKVDVVFFPFQWGVSTTNRRPRKTSDVGLCDQTLVAGFLAQLTSHPLHFFEAHWMSSDGNRLNGGNGIDWNSLELVCVFCVFFSVPLVLFKGGIEMLTFQKG